MDHRYYYIVKDYIYGGLLFDRFHANPSFTESDAAYILQQLLKGVSQAHKQNMIFKELKPENLIKQKILLL